MSDRYPNLEPNHRVETDDEGYQLVFCPFIDKPTTWAPNAEPEEVNCLFCEHLNGDYPLSPEHGDGDAYGGRPPVSGGSHGAPHHVTEWEPCKVPLRRIGFGDAQLVVHDGAVSAVRRVENGWKRKGGNAAYRVRKADTGAYNCRKTTSGRSWSKHSWAVAIDVNWQTNPYGKTLRTDMPKWFVDLWKAEGFGWGGNWKNVKDAMHFSLFVNEGGSGLVYTEEDDMTYEQFRDFLKVFIHEEKIDWGHPAEPEEAQHRTIAHMVRNVLRDIDTLKAKP